MVTILSRGRWIKMFNFIGHLIDCSKAYSGLQRNHQSSSLPALYEEILPMILLTKGQQGGKYFHVMMSHAAETTPQGSFTY